MAEYPSTLNQNFWLRLFPAADYRLPMNVRPGDAKRYWSASPDAAAVLMERRHWIDEAPQRHLLFLPGVEQEASEAVAWFSSLSGRTFADAREAAGALEPDWVLLSGGVDGDFRVLGGAVIFPSSWALEEKLGRPLAQVHDPVPGLAATLGSPIATFLTRIAPGAAWERENWGLSAAPTLNQHPSHQFARLSELATLDTTWLRLEQQFLTRLPATGAILFGIRVTNHRFDTLLGNHPSLAGRMIHALETMSDAMADYKGLVTARAALIHQLAPLSAQRSIHEIDLRDDSRKSH